MLLPSSLTSTLVNSAKRLSLGACSTAPAHALLRHNGHNCSSPSYSQSSNQIRRQYGKYENEKPRFSLIKKPETKLVQPFKYFLILDFEATCDNVFNEPPVQEIIEFPVLKMNSETLEIESQFQEYARPRMYPRLSNFCTSLTGIVQDDVDEASLFSEVMERYLKWLKVEVGNDTALHVTCGDWDLLTQLPRQCKLDRKQVPYCFRKWHNVKLSYCSVTKEYSPSLKGILKGLDLPLVGRPHSGIDDCRNISNIVVELVKRGVVIEPTRQLPNTVP